MVRALGGVVSAPWVWQVILESLATLTLGSSKINQHCWRFHGFGVIAAPQIIGLISFCTGMHHEYPDGEQPKTALWLWVPEITWYLYTRWVRGRMKAKQRWFKVTRELCHEWFHHFRHHVHDGHWTGKFATVIWRLHCFTVSFRGDLRGESGPR